MLNRRLKSAKAENEKSALQFRLIPTTFVNKRAPAGRPGMRDFLLPDNLGCRLGASVLLRCAATGWPGNKQMFVRPVAGSIVIPPGESLAFATACPCPALPGECLPGFTGKLPFTGVSEVCYAGLLVPVSLRSLATRALKALISAMAVPAGEIPINLPVFFDSYSARSPGKPAESRHMGAPFLFSLLFRPIYQDTPGPFTKRPAS